ncbi:MAG: isoleucine--tRNA ligase [Chloroflexi bacterium]|nr:isoleucine--tRNA ligase [Chloroflexota bacterium]
MFKPVTSKVDFPAMERELLAWWQQTGMMEKYLRRNQDSDRRWSFIDGPITANNPMGVHHAWGRAYKDLFQRYKTMQGFKQRYQTGYDGQGLWVEVEVEKEMGFNSKRDIEAYGIDRFVEACKERVRRYADIITQQSIRLGYWMDWDNSYHTMSDENNYTIWHFLKTCHEKGWVYEGTDVMPWCPRCATGLSEHEIVTEGYKELVHPSVFLRFPLEGREGESLLVWTTTPWTLTSNVAAAVHPELTYVKVRQGSETFYLSKALLGILQGEHEVVEELAGERLVGLRYRGPFDELPPQQGVEHRVIPWSEVSESEGTGIVHIAPGAGKEDFALGREFGLAAIAPLDEFGNYVQGFDWLTGRNVAEVTQDIFESLRQKGLLLRVEDYSHRYPVCWRCDSQLVFRLVDEWFISMDDLRHLIADVTRKIRWIPAFGLERELDWLRNMDDWMISKKRYWGLALPIYKCACGQVEVMGSETELKERAIQGWNEFQGHSPHRPWIDAVKIRCSHCGQVVSRIKDVGNPWLDAGIVPFSTLGYRHSRDYWKEWFPADWISESFPGQFRNWFYSLLTMSTALENHEPFRSVFSYALMRDEKGEEMHKSKGNALEFVEAAERMGVDAMRWVFMRHNPAQNLGFGYGTADEVRRRFLLTLWNTYSFFVTYANIDRFDPTDGEVGAIHELPLPPSEMDRWILSELHSLVGEVTRHLDDFDSADASHSIEEFVDILSNWYVRRSRRRFWKPVLSGVEGSESDQDKLSAYHTLYTCLVTLSRLMAPFTPFIADEMYQNLVRSVDKDAPESVHLTSYPVGDPAQIDDRLSQATRLAMTVSSLGRSARSKAGIKVRQPLSRVLVALRSAEEKPTLQQISSQVLDELNVKELSLLEGQEDVLDFQVRLNPAVAGPKYGAQMFRVSDALRHADPTTIALRVRAGSTVEVDGYVLASEEVLVNVSDKPGYASATEGGYTVAVSTELSQELEEEGLARELVHRLQNMRRSAGFDIADHIVTYYSSTEALAGVMGRFAPYIQQETLSEELVQGEFPEGAYTERQTMDGVEVVLGVVRRA